VIEEVTERSWAHVERVRSEAELRASNERFRAAIRAIKGVLWTNDAAGRMVGEQPGWAALTGQPYSQYQGYGWASAVHPEDAQPTIEAWDAAVAGRKTFVFEHRVRRSDGQWGLFSIRAEPILNEVGEVTEWVGVHTDITAERAAAEALRHQSETLETLNRTGAAIAAELEIGPIVQMVTDAGVQLTGAKFGAFFYNMIDETGESMLLYCLSGAERADFDGFGHPRATQVFAPTFNGDGVVRSDDITADPRYGHNPPYHGMPEGHLPVRSYLAVPVTSRSGEVIGGLFFAHPEPGVFDEASERLLLGLAGQAAVAIDNARLFEAAQRSNQSLEQRVVERTRELEVANDALRQSQKMEAIGQLTGGIAHDFNNLLTVIRGSADVLRREGLSEEKRRRYLDAIADTADRAARLTGQLLAFARRQALRPEVFDAGLRITSIAEMLSSVLGSRIRLEIDSGCPDCFVEADTAQFETALVNMAVNARDAMDGEGELKIAVRRQSENGSEFVCVEVADTGQGIDPEKVDRIFEPFFTTKEVGKGTGLGLSQVYGFTKQSDGEIRVESALGVGTTFRLLLPARDDRPKAGADQREVAPPRIGGRVLVVEDNAEVRSFAVDLLQDLGFEAEVAASAQEAMELLSVGSTFDVIFSDVVMPGMSGIEFATVARKRWPEVPIVLTSGYSHVLVEEGQHGFPLLHKPYSAEGVARALHEARKGVGPLP
jgi:PAS domain S-box-containing protein